MKPGSMTAGREKQPARANGFDRNFSSNCFIDFNSILDLQSTTLERKQDIDRKLATSVAHSDDNAIRAKKFDCVRKITSHIRFGKIAQRFGFVTPRMDSVSF